MLPVPIIGAVDQDQPRKRRWHKRLPGAPHGIRDHDPREAAGRYELHPAGRWGWEAKSGVCKHRGGRPRNYRKRVAELDRQRRLA